jgi:hypothetical protein
MIVIPVVQGSQDWRTAKLGIPSASNAHRIITPKTRKPSAQADRYLCELVAERLLGYPADSASSEFMLRGTELEKAAVSAYEYGRGIDTVTTGFCLTDDRRYGCSPDRLVADDGILQVKCVNAAAHVAALLEMKDDEHFAQCQMELLVTGRRWVDLMFYNGLLPERIVRIARDEDFITELRAALAVFCARLDAATDKLRPLLHVAA